MTMNVYTVNGEETGPVVQVTIDDTDATCTYGDYQLDLSYVLRRDLFAHLP